MIGDSQLKARPVLSVLFSTVTALFCFTAVFIFSYLYLLPSNDNHLYDSPLGSAFYFISLGVLALSSLVIAYVAAAALKSVASKIHLPLPSRGNQKTSGESASEKKKFFRKPDINIRQSIEALRKVLVSIVPPIVFVFPKAICKWLAKGFLFLFKLIKTVLVSLRSVVISLCKKLPALPGGIWQVIKKTFFLIMPPIVITGFKATFRPREKTPPPPPAEGEEFHYVEGPKIAKPKRKVLKSLRLAFTAGIQQIGKWGVSVGKLLFKFLCWTLEGLKKLIILIINSLIKLFKALGALFQKGKAGLQASAQKVGEKAERSSFSPNEFVSKTSQALKNSPEQIRKFFKSSFHSPKAFFRKIMGAPAGKEKFSFKALYHKTEDVVFRAVDNTLVRMNLKKPAKRSVLAEQRELTRLSYRFLREAQMEGDQVTAEGIMKDLAALGFYEISAEEVQELVGDIEKEIQESHHS